MKKNSEIKFITPQEHGKYCGMNTISITKQDENKVTLLYKICPYCGKYIYDKKINEVDLRKEYY